MRHEFFVVLFYLIAVPMAHAQDKPPPEQTDPAPTRIEVDAEANVIRFFIEGREQAVLDASGLHVRGSVKGNADLPLKAAQPAGKGAP